MKVKSIGIKTQDSGQLLLGVAFDDEGTERVWVPCWQDVRNIAEIATLIEYTNAKGEENQQLEAFRDTASFMRKVATRTSEYYSRHHQAG